MSVAAILIVDDEPVVRDALSAWFESEDYAATAVSSGEAALDAVRTKMFDVALLDIKMPGMDGMELQARLREEDPELIMILMTGFATVETAVQAMKQGAYDYVTKPVDPEELSATVGRALDLRQVRRESAGLRETLNALTPDQELVGRSPALMKVARMIQMVAPTPATVLITGESGTGKEVVARALHAASPRHAMPLVAIHCGSLTETLLESELFGYEKGAFTGAQNRRKGKFEIADGGTVFLDEIGDISLKTQTDLLRVLQEKEIVRVGGNTPIPVDFRCIAATNKDLEAMVKEGLFRADLFYRLNVVSIRLPPLRERREDIPILADYFLRRFSASMNRPVPELAPGARELLFGYEWPGNVRELENVIERALVMNRSTEIRAADFPFAGQPVRAGGRTLEDVEREHILTVLEENNRNISRAARTLGIDRTTLYHKLRRYRIKPECSSRGSRRPG